MSEKQMLHFYSQQGEDIFIYKQLINKACPDGVFVEIGGYDGITYSNTKFFEDHLGFRGILIEPTKYYENMKNNRPNCDCYNVAVGYTNEPILFVGDNPCAGALETMSLDAIEYHHKTSDRYLVNADTFGNILHKSSLKYVDLMSIDVEGGEYMVLITMDWTIPVYIIIIECHLHDEEKNELCRKLLIEKGFTFFKGFCANEFWVNNNYFRKDLLYDKCITENIMEKHDLLFHFLANHCVKESFIAVDDNYLLEKIMKNEE